DESKEEYKQSIEHLRRIVATITTFTDADQCVDFLTDIQNEKVFMIVSGSLGQYVIPEIQVLSQLHSIYVFCDNRSIHEHWAKTIPMVKGVHTKIELICEALQIDRENCDRGMISVSFCGIDPLFMYTQLLKETFLEIDDDDNKSVKEFVEYCRLQKDITKKDINMVEQEYHHHTPIWWYTAPYFIYTMLNRGLRLMDVDIILKMVFFIRDLHRHIERLHHEQQSTSTTMNTSFQVFRGQGLSIENFEKMKKTKGGLMSFNHFLSTSRNRNVSLEIYARAVALNDPNSVGILFVITVDPILCATSSIPFVEVKEVGYLEDGEEEILFSTHTMFRVDQIERIHDDLTDRLWEVNLTLTGNDNHNLNTLTTHIRKELNWTKGWSRLGDILIKVGEFEKARHLYLALLKKATSDEEISKYNFELGRVYRDMGDNSQALLYYQQVLQFKEKTLPPNHPDVATSYNQIGTVYSNMGEELKALSCYEKDLKISQETLPSNHPNLASSYDNIGSVYVNMGEYSKALSLYEQSLEIRKMALPWNHPNLAHSYSNIANIYYNVGEYAKAVLSLERSLEIKKIALPPNHPNIPDSYNNIGLVYTKMNEYSKALSYFKKALEINQKTVPQNHSSIADFYSNIGSVYAETGKYSKALSSFEQSLEIRKIALPPNHPALAHSYSNIGTVYGYMSEYSKAFLCHERALEIQKIALPQNHPDFAHSYNNIGLVYAKTGKYSKALSSFERSLEIQKLILPPNHPDLARSYSNIGKVYKNMGEHSKALSFHERALEIQKTALPANHPDLAHFYKNIGSCYDHMGDYSKALSYYEKAHDIAPKSLLPGQLLIAQWKGNIENMKRNWNSLFNSFYWRQ
ncbi:unnamed protein product, partial [Rotaria sp. Silwood2]